MVNDGTGHHAGSTRQSLTLDTPLVGPDRDVSTRDLLDEVGIGAVGEVAVVADCGAHSPDIKIHEVLHEGQSMRHPRIQTVNRGI